MLVELALVGIYFLFCWRNNPKVIIMSIFLLIPLHGFIKYTLFADSGSIFSMWKEVGIVLAFFKVCKRRNPNLRQVTIPVFVFFVILLFYGVIGVLEGYAFLADIRKFAFPILLLFAVAKMKYNSQDIKKLCTCILLGTIAINISGVVDFVSPEIRLVMRTIMGTKYSIAADGTVYYEITSYKIMGIDRVAGFMAGGPNMMGVFNSGIIVFSVFMLLKSVYKGFCERLFFFSVLVLSLFCLLTSFSRAGWAITFISIMYLAMMKEKYRKYALGVVAIGATLCIFGYFIIPTLQTVVDGTLSGDEASSAARSEMTQNSFAFLLNHPWGYGLGASNHDGDKFVHFAESTMLNLGVATSFVGIIIYIYLLLVLFWSAKSNRSNPFSFIVPGFVLAFLITACVSVNMVENPFVYYAWLLIGLGLQNNCIPLKSRHNRPILTSCSRNK